MRILVSGASGFIGRPLVQFFRDQGDEVIRLVRNRAVLSDEIGWERLEKERFDAVVNLAGESIFSLRWTSAKKEKILQSREQSAFRLSKILAQSPRPPRVFLSASALGYYGDRGEETIDEASSKGKGFLAEVAFRWEEACASVSKNGVRIVHPRFGIVLGKGGGALQKMLLPYRLGLGAILGDGRQWISWIALEDVLSSIYFALTHPIIEGPYIAASPGPVRQEEFASKLAELLHRPLFLRLPRQLLQFGLGQVADELLLTSLKAHPEKLLSAGFQFVKPSLDTALQASL